jgi:pimeloyl-ACP methyl ester carboxylesterase
VRVLDNAYGGLALAGWQMVYGREPSLAVQATLARLAADIYREPETFEALAARSGIELRKWWCREGTQAALVECGQWAALVFRGTQLTSGHPRERLRDWSVNLRIATTTWSGPGRVHAGYLTALKRVRYEAREFAEAVSATKPIYVAGHSLGGALASGYAAWVSYTHVCDVTPHHVAGLVTFGAPSFGTAKAMQPLYERVPVVRWVRGQDMAPTWVPWFRCPRTGLQRLPGGSGQPRAVTDHDADGYATALAERVRQVGSDSTAMALVRSA